MRIVVISLLVSIVFSSSVLASPREVPEEVETDNTVPSSV